MRRKVAVAVRSRTIRRNLLGRTFLSVGAALVLSVGIAAGGTGIAHAAQTRYFACPLTVPNAGCGIVGSVGPGKYLAEFTYAGPNGYDVEPYVDQCDTTCPVFHWAVARPDRTPAGFQITSDAPFVLSRMLSS